jgi:hypothetical protein
MNESIGAATPQPDESIFEQLKLAGDRITGYKEQISGLEELVRAELGIVGKLYRLYQDSDEAIAMTAAEILESNPAPEKPDKRKAYNPIKNLNIGVRRSYEWQKRDGYNAEDARERVYRSMIDTAKRKGIHAAACVCKGKTEGCSVLKPLVQRVETMTDLPAAVVQKIEQGYAEYGAGKKKKTAKKKSA